MKAYRLRFINSLPLIRHSTRLLPPYHVTNYWLLRHWFAGQWVITLRPPQYRSRLHIGYVTHLRHYWSSLFVVITSLGRRLVASQYRRRYQLPQFSLRCHHAFSHYTHTNAASYATTIYVSQFASQKGYAYYLGTLNNGGNGVGHRYWSVTNATIRQPLCHRQDQATILH